MGPLEVLMGVGGLVLGGMGAWLAKKALDEKHRKTWNEMIRQVELLYEDLRRRSKVPDCIVTVCDGGLIAADLLHIKHLPDVPIVALSRREQISANRQKSVSVQGLGLRPGIFGNMKLLVLDDVIQTGSSLAAAVQYLESDLGVRPSNIHTAVLGRISRDCFDVAYCGFEFKGNVELPWGRVPR